MKDTERLYSKEELLRLLKESKQLDQFHTQNWKLAALAFLEGLSSERH